MADDDAQPIPRRGMQWGLGALVVLALAAVLWPRGTGSPEAPGGFLIDALGRPTPMATRMAEATLVHFWATWCPPCLTEIPALQRLRRDLSGPGVGIVMIAVEDNPERVKTFLGGADADALFDPNWEVAHRYGTRQLPETYLVVRGRVVEKFVGATDWDDPAVRRALATRLAASGVAAEAAPGGAG
jgi:thiol-disulfide isomerase/thioredoxin